MKLVCIKEDNICEDDGKRCPHPKKGEIVNVRDVFNDGFYLLYGYLGYVYDPKCFRPLDYDFVESVLSNIKEEVCS